MKWNKVELMASSRYQKMIEDYVLEIYIYRNGGTTRACINDECVSDKDCKTFEDGVRAIVKSLKIDIISINEVISKLEETT